MKNESEQEYQDNHRVYEQSSSAKNNSGINSKNKNKSDQTVYSTKKNRKKRIVIFSIVILFFLLLTATFLSYMKFEVFNPFTSSVGIIKILATDKPYVVIQKNPKVILAQPDNTWEHFLSYMNEEEYTYLEKERLGNRCFFMKDQQKVNVSFKMNGYYSQWTWEK